MAVNRYDKAAPIEYVSQYIPIPFQELVTLGKYYADQRREAEEQLASNIKQFGKFVSPSKVDMENYHNESIGKLAPFVEQAAANPSLMKDAAFRARIQNAINNIDYSELGRFEVSKNQMIERQKYNKELALRGMYDPLLHDVDFENYDSRKSGQGIFQDVSPLPFKTMHDFVKGWVDNLDYEFQGVTPDGWIKHAVTDKMTDAQLLKNWSAIQNDPHYYQHRERLLKMGIPEEKVDDELETAIFTAGREFTKEKAERDPWWVKQRQREWDLADAAREQKSGALRNLTEILQGDASMLLLTNFTDLTTQEILTYEQLGLNALPADKQRQITQNLSKDYIGDKLFSGFIDVQQNSGTRSGLDWVLNKMSIALHPKTAAIYADQGTTGNQTKDGSYVANDSRNFILTDQLAWNMMQSSSPLGSITWNNNAQINPARQKFENDWKNGNKFHDFIIRSDSRMVTDGENMYSMKYAYIPAEQFDDYSGIEMQQVGGTRVQLGEDAVTFTERINDVGEESTSTSTKKGARDYIRIPVSTIIPQTGEYANTANSLYNKIQSISSKQKDIQVELSNRQVTN